MKSPLAYYLLLLYITVIFRPLIPVVSDMLSHTFNEAIHVSRVHAIYGNNHLAIAVASTASPDNNKTQTTTRFEETVPLHITNENAVLVLYMIGIVAALSLFRIKKWTTIYLSLQLPPPKFFL